MALTPTCEARGCRRVSIAAVRFTPEIRFHGIHFGPFQPIHLCSDHEHQYTTTGSIELKADRFE